MNYKINKKAQAILLRYIETGGEAYCFDVLPDEVKKAVDAADPGEQTYNETTRFLGDNIKVPAPIFF